MSYRGRESMSLSVPSTNAIIIGNKEDQKMKIFVTDNSEAMLFT